MILVTVGQEYSPYPVAVFFQICYVRYDKIDTEHILLRETETAVDYDHVVPVLDAGKVLTYFIESSQRNDLKFCFRQFFFAA